MKLLVVHGEGLGNIIEVLPLLDALDRRFGKVDVALARASYSFSPDLFFGRKVYMPDEKVPDVYDGKVTTVWGDVHGKHILPGTKVLNQVKRQQMRMDQSEVDVYLNAARDLGIPESDFRFDCRQLLGHSSVEEEYDILIADGYSKVLPGVWNAKSYRHYEELARLLSERGLTVGSIGSKKELIPGTHDCTGRELLDTLGLIKNCGVLISNDTGAYHCAAAFRKPAVVLFTFTSVVKNYDSRFHATVVPLYVDNLSCRPDCQRMQRWRKCDHHSCRDYPVNDVMKTVLTALTDGNKKM